MFLSVLTGCVSSGGAGKALYDDIWQPHGRGRGAAVTEADFERCKARANLGPGADQSTIAYNPIVSKCMLARGWRFYSFRAYPSQPAASPSSDDDGQATADWNAEQAAFDQQISDSIDRANGLGP
jgi:hypothetical protein